VVPNLPWLPADPPAAGTHHRVVYVGRISRGRGVDELLALGAELARTGGPTLELVGTPDADVRDRVEAAGHAVASCAGTGSSPTTTPSRSSGARSRG
jgi:hypothetical protein